MLTIVKKSENENLSNWVSLKLSWIFEFKSINKIVKYCNLNELGQKKIYSTSGNIFKEIANFVQNLLFQSSILFYP